MSFWRNIFSSDKAGECKVISSKERKKRKQRKKETRKQKSRQRKR